MRREFAELNRLTDEDTEVPEHAFVKAVAFTYDLARSVVYTRQENPAWSGQERYGLAPIYEFTFLLPSSLYDMLMTLLN